ncbi:MAG: hypothetical protein QOJ12_1278 [Thermoleophilales bacterium]|nr:hypothetical protein [Thermoleophilales bacterium]
MLRDVIKTSAGRVAVAAVVVLALAAAIAMALLWPNGTSDAKLAPALPVKTEKAEVVAVAKVPCPAQGLRNCRRVKIALRSGPDKGRDFTIDEAGGSGASVQLSPGDNVRVTRNAKIPGAPPGPPYSLADLDRRAPMLWLAIAFVVIVSVLGRGRGVMALVGLAASLAVVVFFVVPAILDGRSPLAVALAGGVAVMLVTIALAHGLGAKSIAAALGTAVSLALTVGLAVLFTNLAHLTGFGSEEATLLSASGGNVSFKGLVVAGMVIGALGVLDDVTVSQASAVMALRRANPAQHARELYRGALEVGRDHVAATVNTLVLAYAGATLPLLLLFSVGATPFADALNGESVAEPIVATLVGSIGLIAAVPITTALAALLASRLPAERLPDAAHGHVH